MRLRLKPVDQQTIVITGGSSGNGLATAQAAVERGARVVLAARNRLVAWIGGVGALSPTRVPGHAMRTYSGRPSSSIRFSTSAAIATSVACRPSV